MQTVAKLDKLDFLNQQNCKECHCLKRYTWLDVGGNADYMVWPKNREELSFILKECGAYLPYFVIGAGSNLLIRDGGISGLVIKLSDSFGTIKITGGQEIYVGASAMTRNMAVLCQKAGISGFEFLYTIPGTVGGALKMNSGCYGSQMYDNIISLEVMDKNGQIYQVQRKDISPSYRSSGLSNELIFLSAVFKGTSSYTDSILKTMQSYHSKRIKTQPTMVKTAGSMFKNPEHISAWRLIDEIGYRGHSLGGALINEKHCNFLVNTGSASAKELETLGEEVREKILAQFKVNLEWEIKRIGKNVNDVS